MPAYNKIISKFKNLPVNQKVGITISFVLLLFIVIFITILFLLNVYKFPSSVNNDNNKVTFYLNDFKDDNTMDIILDRKNYNVSSYSLNFYIPQGIIVNSVDLNTGSGYDSIIEKTVIENKLIITAAKFNSDKINTNPILLGKIRYTRERGNDSIEPISQITVKSSIIEEGSGKNLLD